ncbi:ras guanine nucleotide exchange factor domain-containing protein [Crucibulum laeve]|uniref:Ras guanine nucleotide exchange factor domain-containing protein n=1 Tax=Crucibulum laeve TaxID=68775 RepID=A0A5C3MBC8_9AGAR|nr:ras guanine nucleotide exchange factor domain-containing protein [Crucibulum laeve]
MSTTSRSQVARQSLHLRIDPSPYDSQVLISPNTNYSPSSSSARTSIATAGTTPTSDSPNYATFSALCMYDFQSDDPDHLPFRKNEILEIVKQEDTGWWAAMRRGGNMIGWIPQAFVNALTEEMTERLMNVREELRVYEYEAEQLYVTAPVVSQPSTYYDPDSEPLSSNSRRQESKTHPTQRRKPSDPKGQESGWIDDADTVSRPYPPPSPSTPMPHPPTAPLFNKPTPPTPTSPPDYGRHRSGSLTQRNNPRRQPMILDHNPTLSRLSTLIESGNASEVDRISSPVIGGSFDPQAKRGQGTKRDRRNINEVEWKLRNAMQTADIAWYLLPRHEQELIFDRENRIRQGTFDALAEKLSFDSVINGTTRLSDDMPYISAFLMTFRTFTTADRLFEVLTDSFRMDLSHDLSESEFDIWKSKALLPTQKRVLTIFTMWLEDHRLLEEEPHIAGELTKFLALITTPPLAITAKLIVQTIERLTFATPNSMAPAVSPLKKTRKSKPHKNDLLKIDPADIAEQLTVYEYQLYCKITPQECFMKKDGKQGKESVNLNSFSRTLDKVASWVTTTILNNEALAKRAGTVDHWIKVAEKCRNLNNFASMSAIITALSSTVIARLHLTWAHVNRKSTLDTLLRYNDPMGSFSAYRNAINAVDSSCVPFITMYLTEIAHIYEHFHDEGDSICFYQRQKWFEVVSSMLRFQSKPYNNLVQNESTRSFIETQLRERGVPNQHKFWSRSQELQQAELAHADIRKGLEAAGF